MVILSAKNIGKSYGVDVILEGVSFHVNQGDRIGIIGVNGAGKSTLMKILTGEMPHDEGDFFISQDTKIGYLKQQDNFIKDSTVIEEVKKIFLPLEKLEADINIMSEKIAKHAEKNNSNEDTEELLHRLSDMQHEYEVKGGYTYKSEINGILNSMAFSEDYYEKPISTLSGGERTRLALACLLLEKPDILFLDEPTNHLDIGTLKWLEQYLKAYTGTIIIVSHDRYFLDQTVNRIFEVENHKLYTYDGNYTEFAEKKRQRRESELRSYNKQQIEINRQEEMIRRFKQRGTEKLAKRAASREKRLDSLERLDKPEAELGKMKIHFKQNFQSGNDVLIGENLSKSYDFGSGEKKLFDGVNFDIKRGERICIVGANGIGKTTLLKIIMEQIEPSQGYLKIGHNVEFGYYDQGQQLLNGNSTVMDEVHDSFRLYKDAEIRSILGRFLFKNDQVFLDVNSLSGGEKARLSLLKLMLSGANVLILDEPTNHLDINSKEIFEEALLDYQGTIIVVSHDRYFLNKIPTKIVELEKTGLREYLGKYDYYVEKRSQLDSGKKYLNQLTSDVSTSVNQNARMAAGQPLKETKGESITNLSAAEQRALNKQREADERRLARTREKLEAQIEELEGKIADIDEQMCSPENLSDHKKLEDLNKESQKLKEFLEGIYEEYMEIA